MNIAFLSDQHIDTVTSPKSWELAQRVFKLVSRMDHVVLLGDTFDGAQAMMRDGPVVAKFLKSRNLWSPERLSIVPGNHDLFYWSHHGGDVHRMKMLARNFLHMTTSGPGRDPKAVESFLELTRFVNGSDGFEFKKPLGDVTLYGADSSPDLALQSTVGTWRESTDAALRGHFYGSIGNRILCIHHPPKISQSVKLKHFINNSYPMGFTLDQYARLSQFIDEMEIDAVMCGHLHTSRKYTWPVGSLNRAAAHLVGRTGGMHRQVPTFLKVNTRGRMRYEDVVF